MGILTQTVRRLARAPGFVVATISMMSFGVGAATATYAVVTTVLLEPMSPDQDRLVVLYRAELGTDAARKPISLQDLGDWREQANMFEEIAGFGMAFGTKPIRGESDARDARGVLVTRSFFDAVGVQPALGRSFLPEEEQANSEPPVVVSYDLWQTAFGGDASIIGQRVDLGVEEDYTVVGVMPRGFSIPHQAELWFLARLEPPIDRRGWDFMLAVGKLRRGVSLEQAIAEIQSIDARVWEETRTVEYTTRIDTITLEDFALKQDTRSTIWTIVTAIAVLMVIVLFNVVSLCLVRGFAQRRDTVIRAALGATTFQRVRESVLEIALMSAVACVLGIWLSQLFLSGFLALAPGNVPRLHQAAIDAGAILFAAVSTVTIALGIVIPVFSAAKLTGWSFSASLASPTPGAQRNVYVRRALTILQVAAAAFLVSLAVLLSSAWYRLYRADLGYDRSNELLFVEIAGPTDPFDEPDSHRRVLDGLLRQLVSVASVRSAAAVSQPPFSLDNVGWDVWFVAESQGFGFVPTQRQDRETGETHTFYGPALEMVDQNGPVNWKSVSGSYFETMGITLLEGRAFRDVDNDTARRVVIVGKSLAEKLWPGESAIGKRILTYGHRYDEARRAVWQLVVGVAEDARYREIDAARHDLYVPYFQARSMVPTSVAIRTLGEPLLAINELHAALRAVEPTYRLERIRTLDSVLRRQLRPWQFNASLLGVLAMAALMIVAAGVYSVLAQDVAHRTREIGVRLSFGATATDILRMILGIGMRLVLAGLLLGLASALLVSRAISAHLYDVSPTDPTVYAAASILITLVGVVACLVPASRASRLHPVVALRHD